MKPAAVGAVSGLGMIPAHLIFRWTGLLEADPDGNILSPEYQTAVAGAFVGLFAATVAKGGELFRALGDWADDLLEERGVRTDGIAACLRILSALGGHR